MGPVPSLKLTVCPSEKGPNFKSKELSWNSSLFRASCEISRFFFGVLPPSFSPKGTLLKGSSRSFYCGVCCIAELSTSYLDLCSWWFFTSCHGKSPSNHHLGYYVFLFSSIEEWQIHLKNPSTIPTHQLRSTSAKWAQVHTVDGSKLLHHQGCIKFCKINGISTTNLNWWSPDYFHQTGMSWVSHQKSSGFPARN